MKRYPHLKSVQWLTRNIYSYKNDDLLPNSLITFSFKRSFENLGVFLQPQTNSIMHRYQICKLKSTNNFAPSSAHLFYLNKNTHTHTHMYGLRKDIHKIEETKS